MKSAMRLTGSLVPYLVVGIFVAGWRTGVTAAGASTSEGVAAHRDKPETRIANSWDPKAAAAYLDRRQSWWMAWPRAQRDHETFCVSCHRCSICSFAFHSPNGPCRASCAISERATAAGQRHEARAPLEGS